MSDEERPLNERGNRDAPVMGKRLKSRGIKPDILISSPALRAQATALKIAAEIGYSEEIIQIDEKLYFDGTNGMLAVIHSIATEVNTAILFGHNPTMTQMVNYLASADVHNMPTCGVAAIKFSIESWKEVEGGLGKLQLFDYPKRIAADL